LIALPIEGKRDSSARHHLPRSLVRKPRTIRIDLEACAHCIPDQRMHGLSAPLPPLHQPHRGVVCLTRARFGYDRSMRIERLSLEETSRLRSVRLRALADAPNAFDSTLEEAQHRGQRKSGGNSSRAWPPLSLSWTGRMSAWRGAGPIQQTRRRPGCSRCGLTPAIGGAASATPSSRPSWTGRAPTDSGGCCSKSETPITPRSPSTRATVSTPMEVRAAFGRRVITSASTAVYDSWVPALGGRARLELSLRAPPRSEPCCARSYQLGMRRRARRRFWNEN